MKKKIEKKILFLVPSMSGGGAERFLTTLLKNIDRSKFTPVLCLLQKKGPFLNELPADLEVIDLNVKRVRYAFLRIIRVIQQCKPDIVFSTLGHLNLAIMMIKPLLPKKISFIARETNIPSINTNQSPFPNLLPILYRKLYPFFDKVVCQSNDMRMDLVTNFRFPLQKTIVINNPVDVEYILSRTIDDNAILPKEKINILAAGKLKYQKGFDLLIQAFSNLKDERFHLTILGDGPELNFLKHSISKLKLDDHITLAGFQNNPFPYMAQADLFVLSSRFEGFPNVVLEAMACKTPVVAFGCKGGIREIIVDRMNGYIVEPGNTDALANAIKNMVNTEINTEFIKTYVEKKFGIETIISKYEKIFLTG